MTQPKILAFAGSTREGSFNKKLLRLACEAARNAGAEVTCIELKDYPMPLYDGDLEKSEGIPANGMKLMELMIEHDAFLIASPEYNSAMSGVLKNAIDWASRPVPGKKPLVAFDGKTACILSASPGALGGLRGLFALRQVLSNIKVLVIPEQLTLPKANEAFDDNGALKDEKQMTSVTNIARRLVEVATRLKV
jgi:chromate reductase, NAD(P)H dehydrogenase (quinone)